MFAHKKNYGRAGYVDDPLPNIVYISLRMPACIVWLYYASSSTVWWFSDHFFFCLVCGPLEKNKKKIIFIATDKKNSMPCHPTPQCLHSYHLPGPPMHECYYSTYKEYHRRKESILLHYGPVLKHFTGVITFVMIYSQA